MHPVQPLGPSSQQQLDVTVDEQVGLRFARHWSATEIESWLRLTMKLANQAAMRAADRKKALENRARFLTERWEQAVPHIPDSLRAAMWENLSAPLTA